MGQMQRGDARCKYRCTGGSTSGYQPASSGSCLSADVGQQAIGWQAIGYGIGSPGADQSIELRAFSGFASRIAWDEVIRAIYCSSRCCNCRFVTPGVAIHRHHGKEKPSCWSCESMIFR